MQLPSSTYGSNYSQAQTPANSVQSSRTEKPQNTEAASRPNESAKAKPVETEAPQRSSDSFSSVEEPQASELPQQEIVTREAQVESTGNRATDQYQQIASEGASNAQAQDPSLFRVDVYV